MKKRTSLAVTWLLILSVILFTGSVAGATDVFFEPGPLVTSTDILAIQESQDFGPFPYITPIASSDSFDVEIRFG